MDQLRPFFTLCQACGMIPYSINYNFKTNVKTVRFSFSFRNFVTWWFLAILVLQLGIPCMIFVFSQMFFTDVSSDGEAPVTITVLGTSTVFCFVAQLFVARWIVLRYYKLFRHIIKSAYVIERLLQVGNHQVGNSITKRFYSALLLIAMVSTCYSMSSIPLLKQVLDNSNLLSVVFISCIQVFLFIMFDCFLLTIHLCYCIVALYIELLRDQITSTEGIKLQFGGTKRNKSKFLRSNITSDIDTLKRHGEIFNGICNLSLKFNRVFSVPVFVTLLAHFIIIISSLFIYVYGLVNGKAIMEEYNYILVTGSIFSSLRILILLSTADIPLDQIRLLREQAFDIVFDHQIYEPLSKKLLWKAFIEQMDENRIRLSAAGLFAVGRHLVPHIIGTIVTYMIILLQN